MVGVVNMVGQKWGTWEVLGAAASLTGRARWLCKCTKCGVEKELYGTDIRRYASESGCRDCHKRTERFAFPKEYAHWCEMRTRVTNRNRECFSKYSTLGIEKSWVDSFSAFLSHIGPCPGPGYTVDRKDNAIGYYPGNVRWATSKEQARNTSRNIWVWVNGVRMVLIDAAPILGIPYNTLRDWAHR